MEKKQERDWRMDEDFKKFMGNPSIEAALKLERKRAEEKLKEIDSQEQGNFFKGLINNVVRSVSPNIEAAFQAFPRNLTVT